MKTDNLYAVSIRVFLLRPQLMEPYFSASDISCMAACLPAGRK